MGAGSFQLFLPHGSCLRDLLCFISVCIAYYAGDSLSFGPAKLEHSVIGNGTQARNIPDLRNTGIS